MAKAAEERDHVDRFLEENQFPGIDLEVEAIVDRINGLRRRFHRLLDETLVKFGLNSGEWKTLNGKKVRIRVSGSNVFVNTAKVVKADVMATNGVIHVVIRVLIPPAR